MKTRVHFPITALPLLVCWVIFAYYVWQTAALLPERVATHFGMDGVPNGWMTRTAHVRFTIVMGIGGSAFVLVVFTFIRWCGDTALNIPHKAYWLARERREATYAFIEGQGLRFALVLIFFIGAVHHTILTANLRRPASLAGSDAVWLGGGLIGVTLLWVAVFLGRFFRKPA